MTNTQREVLELIKENGVKFVRLGFCDLLGVQKNISFMADQLQDAFEYGISLDASAIKGFGNVKKSDLLLFPDPATLTVLPWRPGPGRVVRFLCDIRRPGGSLFTGDGRYCLKQVIQRCEQMGYVCKIGAECEFYLFKTDEDGEPTGRPLDYGGYFDIAPLDKGEDIRSEISLSLDEMGIKPETSHHEQGPGQNEISFEFSDALSCADNLLAFKSVVKTIASRNGLYASFLPKPLADSSGSGLHVNLSLSKDGFNLFQNTEGEGAGIAESFIAGILEKTPEMTLFLNPLANSYQRFGKFEAPLYVSWSHQNRSQLVRIPAATGKKMRMELRSPDPSLNPYLAFALILAAGLDGVERNLSLPPALDADLYAADPSVTGNLPRLPGSLQEAIRMAGSSAFVKAVLGEEVSGRYLRLKTEEAEAWEAADDPGAFFYDRYFRII